MSFNINILFLIENTIKEALIDLDSCVTGGKTCKAASCCSLSGPDEALIKFHDEIHALF